MSVYRAFMIFNAETQQVLFYLRRGTVKSFSDSVLKMIDEINKQAQETTKHQVYLQHGRCEWYAILDNDTRCYFCVLLFAASNEAKILQGLEQIKKVVKKVTNYNNLSDTDLQAKIGGNIQAAIENAEEDYIRQTPTHPRDRRLSEDPESIAQMSVKTNQFINNDLNVKRFNSEKRGLKQSQVQQKSQSIQFDQSNLGLAPPQIDPEPKLPSAGEISNYLTDANIWIDVAIGIAGFFTIIFGVVIYSK